MANHLAEYMGEANLYSPVVLLFKSSIPAQIND